MTKLNRKIEYALMALKHMSKKYSGQLTSAKEVSAATGAPFDATARVMQLMSQKGLLKSEQGSRGGYLIVKDLSKVNLYELIEMILGPVEIAKCINGNSECELLNNCNIQSPVSHINKRLVSFYSGIALSEVLTTNNEASK